MACLMFVRLQALHNNLVYLAVLAVFDVFFGFGPSSADIGPANALERAARQ